MNDLILALLLNEEITNVVQCSIGYIQKDHSVCRLTVRASVDMHHESIFKFFTTII